MPASPARLSVLGRDLPGQRGAKTVEHRGKGAIVTGGGGGIGRAIALGLAGEGAAVTIADLNLDAARKVAQEISDRGGEALAVQTDVAEKASVDSAVRQTLDTFGRIDILVNNAGVQHVSPIVDFPEAQWHALVGVILTGTFFCTQAVLPSMISRGSGRIINISSVLGRIGQPYKAAYCAAKHGVIGLTRVTALETAEHGITVNAICPGVTRTEIVENQLDGLARTYGISRDEVLDKVFFPQIPQKRLMDPGEVAECVLFLASDRAFALTGQAINFSAGWVMQ